MIWIYDLSQVMPDVLIAFVALCLIPWMLLIGGFLTVEWLIAFYKRSASTDDFPALEETQKICTN